MTKFYILHIEKASGNSIKISPRDENYSLLPEGAFRRSNMRRSHMPATCACNLECAEAVYTEPRGASTGKMAATGKRELLAAAAAATALAASGSTRPVIFRHLAFSCDAAAATCRTTSVVPPGG